MFILILISLIGLAFLVIGWLLWKKQRILLIHSYHYNHVLAADKPAYTTRMGKACLVMGLGCLLCGFINFIFDTGWGWAAFALCFLPGCLMMLAAQRRYNRSGSQGG